MDTWTVENIWNYDDYCAVTLRSPEVEVFPDPLKFYFIDKNEYDITLPLAGKKISFSVKNSAAGGTAPYKFSKVSGPAWLSVSSDGTVSGTPAATGENADLVVRVRDKNGSAPVYGDITIDVYPTKTEISKIVADSNLDEILTGGTSTAPSFTMRKGQAASFGSAYWRHHTTNEYGQEIQPAFENQAFVPGETYDCRATFAIDGSNRDQYVLAEDVTVIINGQRWITEQVERGGGSGSSLVYAHSVPVTAGEILQSGKTYVIASAKDQNYALDVAGGSSNVKANVDIYKRNNSEGQAFTLTQLSDGSWKIRNYKGMVLDIAGGSTANKANVQTYTWNNSAAQKYAITKNSDGTYTFINQKSGKALDIAGGKMANKTNVQQYTSNGSQAQKWVLIDVTAQMAKNYPKYLDAEIYGTCVIQTCVNQSFVLDIAGGSAANKANVQIYSGNGSAAQTFSLTYRGSGLYSIANQKSGKVLDVSGGKAANKQNVQQYTWNGSKAQLWKIEEADGGWRVRSALNNAFVLDLAGGKAANKKNVQIYKANNSKAQTWYFN